MAAAVPAACRGPPARAASLLAPGTADNSTVNARVVGIVLGLVAVVGGFFATWVAAVWSWVACCSESGLDPHPATTYQVGVAALGLLPAIGTVASGIAWPRLGNPWYWFGATVAVYAVWLGYAAIAMSM